MKANGINQDIMVLILAIEFIITSISFNLVCLNKTYITKAELA